MSARANVVLSFEQKYELIKEAGLGLATKYKISFGAVNSTFHPAKTAIYQTNLNHRLLDT